MTGATGIAAATARLLTAGGAAVHVVSNVEDDARSLAEEIGGTWAVADLTDEAQTEAAFAPLERLDALGVIAGGSGRPFGDGLLADVSLAAWEATIRLNLTTAFLTAREGLRIMRRVGEGDGLRRQRGRVRRRAGHDGLARVFGGEGGHDRPEPRGARRPTPARASARTWWRRRW